MNPEIVDDEKKTSTSETARSSILSSHRNESFDEKSVDELSVIAILPWGS